MVQAAQEVQRKTGAAVTYVLGNIGVAGAGGGVLKVKGVQTPGKIIVQADHPRFTVDQIAAHETFHDLTARDVGMVYEAEQRIKERYNPDELGKIVAVYTKKLRGIVDIPANATPDQMQAAELRIWEELCADAYAGMNAFEQDVSQYQETVQEVVQEREAAEPSRENAQATERKTGPTSDSEVARETQRSKDIEETRRSLREAYDSGSISEEDFDQAMDIILEQESLDDVSMLEIRGQEDGRERYSVDWGDGEIEKGLKERQLETILESNPAEDEYHTWIRSVNDIKTLREAVEDEDWAGYDEYNPDYTRSMAEEAIESGEIRVYSSHPIENGGFVTPSRMEAESYAGRGRIYSKTVRVEDVAWIDPTQGQYAPNQERYSVEDEETLNEFAIGDDGHIYLPGQPMPEAVKRMRAEEQSTNTVERNGRATEQSVQDPELTERYSSGDNQENIVDTLPKKAQNYLSRAERAMVRNLGELLSVPTAAQREYLQDTVREISEEYLRDGRVSQETADRLFEDAYAQGVMVQETLMDEYRDLYDRLRSTDLVLAKEYTGDIPDFEAFRKKYLGRLKISTKGRTNIDQVYMELADSWPQFFGPEHTHPSDQLEHIAKVMDDFRRVEMSLDDYYGRDGEFKRWAKHDFEVAVTDMMGELPRPRSRKPCPPTRLRWRKHGET